MCATFRSCPFFIYIVKKKVYLERNTLHRLHTPLLDSILKIRDITLPTKVHIVKAIVSSSHVWM